jgi:hypothetical protein
MDQEKEIGVSGHAALRGMTTDTDFLMAWP